MNFTASKKPGRYHNSAIRSLCLGGCGKVRKHDSKAERDYCNELRLRKMAGDIRDYTTQITYDLHTPDDTKVYAHRVDFYVVNADGKPEVHEYKGGHLLKTAETRLKKALFQWCYPNVKYVLVTIKRPEKSRPHSAAPRSRTARRRR